MVYKHWESAYTPVSLQLRREQDIGCQRRLYQSILDTLFTHASTPQAILGIVVAVSHFLRRW